MGLVVRQRSFFYMHASSLLDTYILHFTGLFWGRISWIYKQTVKNHNKKTNHFKQELRPK